MKLKVGFTGTQNGMDLLQKSLLRQQLREWSQKYDQLEIHHGDCIGADSNFHSICLDDWPHQIQVVLHPPRMHVKRAFSTITDQIDLPEDDYIARNHSIVDSVNCMLAAPRGSKEVVRSGTWATIRYAQKTKCPLLILWSDINGV